MQLDMIQQLIQVKVRSAAMRFSVPECWTRRRREMPFATMLVIGAIAAFFLVVAVVLMWLDVRAQRDGPPGRASGKAVRAQQARFPRSIR
jgi:hypothetical protein